MTSMDTGTERDLILRCQQGDAEAFGGIYDLYVRKIHDFIYYKVHHRETAQDLTSDTFMKALGGLDRFDAGKGSISSWLYRIARNTVIDHYRTKKEYAAIDDAWDIPAGGGVEADIDALARIDRVRQQLRVLPPDQRDIVIMRVWQELSYREIAEIVGKSEDNCKMIFCRAAKKLRETMPLALFIALFINHL